jgi:hypothetical protein
MKIDTAIPLLSSNSTVSTLKDDPLLLFAGSIIRYLLALFSRLEHHNYVPKQEEGTHQQQRHPLHETGGGQ